MPINAHPDYIAAEKEYFLAETPEDKIEKLKKMISLCPGHKGAENLRAQLKTRLKKLQKELEKAKKSKTGKRQGIKKESMQAVIIGFTNSGKSSLLSSLTNIELKKSRYNFTTTKPAIGMMNYLGVQVQLIENPAVNSDYYDRGLTNSTDTILILITDLKQISEIEEKLEKAIGKKIIVFNKIDLLNENEKRKISATLQSRKYNFVLISTETSEGIEELKNKLFSSFDKIRIYTKEPWKEKSSKPIIMKPNAIIRDVAEKILKGFSEKITETKIWGPSSKFPGQRVGLHHKLKDMDIVEFKTR